MALPIKKPYESLSKYLERTLPGELESGKSRGKATADIMFAYNKEPDREMFLPFIWGAAGNGGAAIVATGGTITQDGDYKVHTFTSNGTFEITAGSNTVNYLVQGGGGSGAECGNGFRGAGAGGGINVNSLPGTVKSYSVVVGAGGLNPAGTCTQGTDGSDSTFDTTIIGCGGDGGTYDGGGIGGSNCDFTATGRAGASNNANATLDTLGPDGLFSSITGTSIQYGRGGDSDTATPRTGVIGQGGNGGSDASIEPGDGENGIVITRYYSPASGGGGSDPDADAYIFAVVTAGGTVDATIEAAVDTLFVDLKAAGLYSKMSFMHPYVGGVADSNKINAINPGTNDLTFTGAFTHNSLGTVADVRTAVANTGWVGPPTGGSISDFHYSYYTGTTNAIPFAGGAVYLQEFGNLDTLFNTNAVFSWLSGADYTVDGGLSYFNGGTNTGYLQVSQAVMNGTIGLFGASRTSTTSMKAFKDGAQVGTTQTAVVNQSWPSTTLMSPGFTSPPNASGNQTSSTRRRQFTSFGTSLSDAEFTTLYSIVQTFQTSLSRAV